MNFMSMEPHNSNYHDIELYEDENTSYYDEEYLLEEMSNEEVAAALQNGRATDYNDKYILKRLMEGMSREELAQELDHKSYRTLDMYMRRRGYRWDGDKQIYILKPDSPTISTPSPATSKVQRILALFKGGIDPREIAKRVGIKDHRTMAMYMKSKGYIWSSDKQTYVLLKGKMATEDSQDNGDKDEIRLIEDNSLDNRYEVDEGIDFSREKSSKLQRLERLIPMLEMIDRNKDKLIQLLAINEGGTIPRYVVGGVTITKSLCMSHPLDELVKEFSKEKNISQKEIFEVAVIEFLKKYGYDNEIKALFV